MNVASMESTAPSQPITLGGAETWESEYTLDAGAVIAIDVEQMGIDVVLRLYDPSGERILEMDGPYGAWGPERITWVAEKRGEYRLEIVSDQPDAPPGRIRLEVSPSRPATEDDRRLAAAVATLCRADEARRSADHGRLPEALEGYKHSLGEFEAIGDVWWQLQAWQRIGQTAARLEERAQAMEAHESALALARRAGLTSEAARSANRIVARHLVAHDLEAAATRLDEAETLAADSDDAVVQISVASNRAALAARRGDREAALASYLALEARCRDEGHVLEAAGAVHHQGDLLLRMRRPLEAATAFERAAEGLLAGGDLDGHARVLVSQGEALVHGGAPERALEVLTRADDIGKGRLDARWSAYLANSLALAMARTDRPDRVARASAWFEEAVEAARSIQDGRFQAVADFNHGAFLQREGRPVEARAAFERALAFYTAHDDREREAMARLGIGLARRDTGDLQGALRSMARAVSLVETQRLRLASSSFRMMAWASKWQYFEALIELLVELHMRGDQSEDGSLPYAEQALELVERRRARTLLDTFGEYLPPARIDPRSIEEERRILESLAEVGAEMRTDRRPELERLHRTLTVRLDSVRGRMRAEHPQYADLTRSKPLSVEQIRQRVLDAESHLLVFSLGTDRSFVWSVPRHGDIEVATLPARDVLTPRVKDALRRVRTQSREQTRARDRSLAALGQVLLGPIAHRLREPRLVIVPDGMLELVPFAALRVADQQADDDQMPPREHYLVEHHEVVVLPSASVLAASRDEQRTRRPPSLEIVVVADPVFSSDDDRMPGLGGPVAQQDLGGDAAAVERAGFGSMLPRLRNTRREAEAIAALVVPDSAFFAVGHEARKDSRVLDSIASGRMVHLATHGLIDPDLPQQSALALSLVDPDGTARDGLLFAHEIYGMRIAAELVVLSACETGVGPDVAGEGTQGLARAFLYAGAQRVVTSQWTVGDESTAALMVDFYRRLLDQDVAPATALRQTQLAMLAGELGPWTTPRHWAAFTFVGDWRVGATSIATGDDPIERSDAGAVDPDPLGDDPDYPVPADPDPSGSGGRSNPKDRPSTDRFGRTAQRHQARQERIESDQYINGIDADTGQRVSDQVEVPDATPESLLDLEIEPFRELQSWPLQHHPGDPERPAIYGKDEERLDHVGWGVLFGPGVDDETKKALEPLLDLRKAQAGGCYRKIDLKAGATSLDFRYDHEIGFGAADPEKVPYYLMIVGDPREIPFELQYGLDVQYAVGRLHLDRIDDYHAYVRTVLRAERGGFAPRAATVFGVHGEAANERFLLDALVDPLADSLRNWRSAVREPVPIGHLIGREKAHFAQLFDRPPGFLFAAAHGLRCAPDDPTLPRRQGAIVCSDSALHEGATPDTYFTGDDLSDGTDLEGMVAFLFACYGAGTPRNDDFLTSALGGSRPIAPYPLVSHLAKRMLAQGAQAVVGHIDRAWSTSFDWTSRKGDQVKTFTSACAQLLDGGRLGHAMEWIDIRYAEGATELSELVRTRTVRGVDHGRQLARVRKATLDARNYVVLGDPAVRLPGLAKGRR